MLQLVTDELEIRNLLMRLAHLADYGDLKEYAGLFTEDGRWESRPVAGAPIAAPLVGHADILAAALQRRADGILGPGTHTRHVLTTTTVQISGDTAKASSYLTIYKNTNTEPVVKIWALYADDWRRTHAGWRLASRVISYD